MTFRYGVYLFFLAALSGVILNGCGASRSTGSSASSQIPSSGTGTSVSAPAATITPTSYTFNSQLLNSSSTAETVTLANTGDASMSLTSVKVSGDFAQTNDCGTTLAAGANCTVNVTFTPTAAGVRTGTVSFSDNAPQSPQVVSLSGIGVTAGQCAGILVDNPSSISFGNVTVGQIKSQAVTITNAGGQSVSVTSVSTSGAGLGASGISTSFALAPNQSITFTLPLVHPAADL